MTRRLKDILLSIAQLPLADQRWILKRLPSAQRTTFERLHGLQQLQEARRFRTLPPPKAALLKSPPFLPDCCDILANKDALYIATILEQGAYAWTTDFLQQYDKEGIIRSSLEHQVTQLKPLVKQALFMEWEKRWSFESYLEESNG
jgi:hypothetical protein